jgi:hypothetical protein
MNVINIASFIGQIKSNMSSVVGPAIRTNRSSSVGRFFVHVVENTALFFVRIALIENAKRILSTKILKIQPLILKTRIIEHVILIAMFRSRSVLFVVPRFRQSNNKYK